MISNIRIKNFKSLKNVSLNLKELNLMMGLNSMGKSSVVQSLLMLRQSYIKTGSFKNLYINGELVSLGNSKDVFYQNADVGDLIEFEIAGEKSSCFVSYNYVEGKDVLDSNEEKVFNETDLSLFSNCFHYLAADHISPSKTYKATNALSIYAVSAL